MVILYFLLLQQKVKEIPIEEFGGLESSGKVDSEKHVFSVITTNVTDSFSMDSPEELCEWTILLQEYLGKGDWSYLHVHVLNLEFTCLSGLALPGFVPSLLHELPWWPSG